MAKNKSDSTSLILKIVAIVAGVLSFVGMAFKSVTASSNQVSSISESASISSLPFCIPELDRIIMFF